METLDAKLTADIAHAVRRIIARKQDENIQKISQLRARINYLEVRLMELCHHEGELKNGVCLDCGLDL